MLQTEISQVCNIGVPICSDGKSMLIVISHIGSERPEPGPYKWCWFLTCCTRFGVMRGYQKQNHEGDLSGSPGHGWTGRSKTDNIQHVGPGRYIN